jgi:hypothetical protein
MRSRAVAALSESSLTACENPGLIEASLPQLGDFTG